MKINDLRRSRKECLVAVRVASAGMGSFDFAELCFARSASLGTTKLRKKLDFEGSIEERSG